MIQRKVRSLFLCTVELSIRYLYFFLTQKICQDAQEGETHLQEDTGDHSHVHLIVTLINVMDVILNNQDVTEHHRVCKVVWMDKSVPLHLSICLIFHLDMKRIKRIKPMDHIMESSLQSSGLHGEGLIVHLMVVYPPWSDN